MVTLDTCSIVWLSLMPEELSRRAKKAIDSNELIISDISLWEIAMLIKSRRIQIDSTYKEYIALVLNSFDLAIKPITPEISDLAVNFNTSVNKDPADRIISATSIIEKAPLVTRDVNLRKSRTVSTIW